MKTLILRFLDLGNEGEMFKSKEKMVTDQLKRVYAFGKDANGKNVTEGNTNMKAILGGKGANLAEMANIGLPVPPGFTISCQTCMEYANSNNTWPEGVLEDRDTPISTISASRRSCGLRPSSWEIVNSIASIRRK